MNQTKRQLDDTIDENNNKKQKFDNEIIIQSTKSYFENLANETIYEIFEYIDVYHIYYGFFYLNNRFQNLILNSNFPIQIYIPIISKINFELYSKNLILPNRHRINILHLSNPFTIDLILSPPRLINEFIQLEKLIFDHIDCKYLPNIFRHLINLTKLHSLTLSLVDSISNPTFLFISILRLPYLKTCQLTYQLKNENQLLPIDLIEYRQSSIENFTINSHFPFASLSNLFSCLPNLCYLSIDYLIGSNLIDLNLSSIVLKYLKYVSIKFDNIHFDALEKLTNYYFHSVEIFYISIKSSHTYLNPERWEELINKFMPNLRIFDLNYIDCIRENNAWFHFLILPFDYSFWNRKKWFFTHQHDYRNNEDHGILYSTNPYRRKDYILYWKSCNHSYSKHQEKNLNSVEYLQIYGTRATYCGKYFPNVTELILGNYFKTSDKSISITLNRIFPLKQLKKLYIPDHQFPFEEIIQLLHSTSNLHTLKLDCLLVFQLNLLLLEQNEIFQYILYKFILKFFPQIEYLEIGMVTRQINEILKYLFSNTHRLRFLCFSQTPKRCLKELNTFIKSENLIHNYSMKLLNRQLYLWW